MSKWKSIAISQGHILAESANAYKIALPKKSEYKNYYFWHPKKLVRPKTYKDNSDMCLSYTDEFVFHLIKDLPKIGKTKKEDISAAVLRDIFWMYNECIPYVHKPEKLKPVHIEADPELIDNE